LTEDRKSKVAFSSADQIRAEMDRVIPSYRGIKDLANEGDSFQYGGPMLLKDGICNTNDGRAKFSAVRPKNEILQEGEFCLATRRGKQFNSIVYGTADSLVGSKRRNEIFISPADASKYGLIEGCRIKLKSEAGEFEGICKIARVHPGTLQMYWPESNVLISREIDPESQEPDYNTRLRIVSVSSK
jgi:anaerobic selenocysteine-containing dehydrogenase